MSRTAGHTLATTTAPTIHGIREHSEESRGRHARTTINRYTRGIQIRPTHPKNRDVVGVAN